MEDFTLTRKCDSCANSTEDLKVMCTLRSFQFFLSLSVSIVAENNAVNTVLCGDFM